MIEEIEYALDTLGLDGVMISSNIGGHYFGDPFLEPVLAELDRRVRGRRRFGIGPRSPRGR
ncbi:hypothetical protein DKM19_31960 [Streptosporangium sp. 'caverna']|nr:hypothetical protein DKM19_31960 [Streptosporangium sp. 'caverna']